MEWMFTNSGFAEVKSDKMANVLRMCAARLVLASVLTHKVCESQAVVKTRRAEFNLNGFAEPKPEVLAGKL